MDRKREEHVESEENELNQTEKLDEEETPTIRSRSSQTILTSSRSLRISLDTNKLAAVMQRTTSERSLAEIPRRSNSSSDEGPPSPQEVVTLTMDYDSLPNERHNNINANECIVGTADISSSEIGHRRDAMTNSPPPTIYSFIDHERIARRGCSLFCCTAPGGTARSIFQQSDTRAPPAYSVLFPRYGHSASDFQALHPSSFVALARTPPPSYAQAQGICVAYSLEQLISNTGSNGRFWSPRPTTAVCPRCATLVITVVNVQQATATHLTALALCFMGCWPCCMLPYYIDTCKTSRHYCPFCRSYLGTYIPW